MKKFKINNKTIYAESLKDAISKYKAKTSFCDDELDDLSNEERQAIEDYRLAIQNTSNPRLLELYAHILQEETEHLKELQNAKEYDSFKDEDYDIARGNGSYFIKLKHSNKAYEIKFPSEKEAREYIEENSPLDRSKFTITLT